MIWKIPFAAQSSSDRGNKTKIIARASSFGSRKQDKIIAAQSSSDWSIGKKKTSNFRRENVETKKKIVEMQSKQIENASFTVLNSWKQEIKDFLFWNMKITQ
jgi:hypothetical protein